MLLDEMTLDELLTEIRNRRLILTEDARLWSPNTRIPQRIRSGITQYRADLRNLIELSSIDVCPSVDLHRPHWKYARNGAFCCEICQKYTLSAA